MQTLAVHWLLYSTVLQNQDGSPRLGCWLIYLTVFIGEMVKKSTERPISLTPTVGKILESIMTNKITVHLEEQKLIKLFQQEYPMGFSSLANLLSFCSEVYEIVDSGKEHDIMYLL